VAPHEPASGEAILKDSTRGLFFRKRKKEEELEKKRGL
jgi:hypothetical protein